jgi:hypothetical protein
MTSEVFGSGGGAELASAVGVALLGTVPLGVQLRGERPRPRLVDPDAEAARAIVAVARRSTRPRRRSSRCRSVVLNEAEVKPRLVALGFSDADAQTLADHFVDAERRGESNHRFSRVRVASERWTASTRPRASESSEPATKRWRRRGAVKLPDLAAACAADSRRRPRMRG